MVKIKKFENSQLNEVKKVVKEAFYFEGKDLKFNEWNFIDSIRNDKAYIEELCLTAINDKEYIGYILLTEASINEDKGLALGPIAVKSSKQKMGVGKKLVREAINKAKDMGYDWIILVGGDYYYQFGFCDAEKYDIKISENHPENKYIKIIILNENTVINNGYLKFADSFYNENGELL